jgi:hypothetical protein
VVFQHDITIWCWKDAFKISLKTTHDDSKLTESTNMLFKRLIYCYGLVQREFFNYPFFNQVSCTPSFPNSNEQ